MKRTVLAGLLALGLSAVVSTAAEVRNGARGLVYEVDTAAKEFTLLTTTAYDPEQMGKENRFRVRYSDKTVFTLVKTERNLLHVPAEGRDAVAFYLKKEEFAKAEETGKVTTRTLEILPTCGRQKQEISAERGRIYGMVTPAKDRRGLTATLTVGEREFSYRLGRRGTVRFVSPSDASALLPCVSTARIGGREKDGTLEVTRIEVSHLPDPRKTDDPNLPRVLIIGDSISMNYNASLKGFLAGKANYHRIDGNAGPTSRGVTSVDLWLGPYHQKGLHWDAIQFNHGLHDLAKNADGTYLSDESQYKKNLEYIISRLKLTEAKLIWATTTPVPNDGGRGRKKGASKAYNAYAAEVLKNHPEVRVTDLYAVAISDAVSDEWRQGNNVHFGAEDSAALGKAAADGILAVLGQGK